MPGSISIDGYSFEKMTPYTTAANTEHIVSFTTVITSFVLGHRRANDLSNCVFHWPDPIGPREHQLQNS